MGVIKGDTRSLDYSSFRVSGLETPTRAAYTLNLEPTGSLATRKV